MEEKLWLECDDRLNVGKKPLKHTNPEAQEFHDWLMKHKKEFVRQFIKEDTTEENK